MEYKSLTQLFPFQRDAVNKINGFGGRCLLAMEMGTGKAQRYSSKVLTDTGWVRFDQLQLGDNVCSDDGKFYPVNGIYPQGVKKFYRVRFEDNTFLDVAEEHLWSVSFLDSDELVTYPTKTLYEKFRHSVFYIPIVSPIQFSKKRGIKNPYTFGLKFDFYDRGGFIPKEYLFADLDSRIMLFKGLVSQLKMHPTDSFTLKCGTDQVRQDIMDLARSLGCFVKEGLDDNKSFFPSPFSRDWDFGGFGASCYEATIKMPSFLVSAVFGEYAVKLCRPDEKLKKRVTAIEELEEDDCCCIEVGSPSHLYVTDDFIVTHNTICAATYILESKSFPAVIVCPASLKYNWAHEFQIHYNKRVTILSGTDPTKFGTLIKTGDQIYVINYDILHAWVPTLLKLEPKILVLDESQMVKSVGARRTRACAELALQTDKFLALTGTPITGNPMELYTTLNMIFKGHIVSKWEFMNRYTTYIKTHFGIKVLGPKHEQELNTFLNNRCMIRKKTEEVLPDLPPFRRQTTLIEMTNSQKREYEKLKADFVVWMNENYPDRRVSRSEEARILTQFGYLKRTVAEWKVPAVIDHVKTFLSNYDGKLIIFGIHKKILNSIWTAFDRMNKKNSPFIVSIDGSTPAEVRQRAVESFQNNPGTRLFLGQIQAAGVGLTLTSSSHSLFAELDFSPIAHEQAERRNLRIGTKASSVHYNYLLMKDTIEEYVANVLFRKSQTIAQVIDGKQAENNTTEIGGTFNLVNLILRDQFRNFLEKNP